MTPIKASDYLKHSGKLAHVSPVVDLRELNLAHAAPVENGTPFLTMRYDLGTGGLHPSGPDLTH